MQRKTHPARRWLVYALGTVLLAFGVVSFTRKVAATQPVVGVEWVESSVGPMALAVAPGSPAAVSGLIPGDVLERVNADPAETVVDARNFAWNLEPEQSVTLGVLRGGRQIDLVFTPEFRDPLPGAPIYAFLALVGLAFLVSGVFIALRWPTIRGGMLYTLLGAATFGLLVFSPTGEADTLDWVISWLDIAAGSLAPALLLHLAMTLSRRLWRYRVLGLFLAYSPAAILMAWAGWLALGGQYRFEDPVAALEIWDRAQLLFLALSVPLTAAMFARSYNRSASALHRSQMRWLLWGLGIGLTPFVAVYAIPWVLGGDVPGWTELSIFPMVLVPAAFTAALVRYRLHDLDVLLRRGLTEVTAIFFTLAFYGITQVLLRPGSAGLFSLSNSAARYFGILAVAFAYPPIRSWVRVWVDRAFYRKRYSYRATLLDWARQLNAETDLNAILDNIRERVRNTLLVSEVQIFLRIGEHSLEGHDETGGTYRVELTPDQIEHLERHPSLTVPKGSLQGSRWVRHMFGMRVKGEVRAVLAVAERDAEQEPLSSEDRALLSTLSAHAATAIEAARLLREVREGADEVARLQSDQARILESSGVGLLLVDGEGRIKAWNRALENIYGLAREEALSQRLSDVFPLHLVRTIEREIKTTPDNEDAKLYRYSLVNRSGGRVIVNIDVSAAGEYEGGARVVSFDDVTERVKLEEQVLQQERLAALGMLAAGVAHEVNTPVTGISSYAQMLLEDLPESDPRREILEKIEAQTRRVSNIANSLLNMAQPQRTAFESLSVTDNINEVIRLFEPQIRGRGIRLETTLDPDVPAIRGHRGKLQQVLLNLLLNARDAIGREGTIAVVTRVERDDVVVEVTDNGSGIAEEDLRRIFDPFFTTKGRGQGTGLGLSISYGIIREHGGDIQVESHPGEFTRFRVTLPTAEKAEALA
ncbi:MAG: ATP-binding protein [Acidobacteriota bacterium]|nr:ATP-binding protein [Acidobacteriota bacterium]